MKTAAPHVVAGRTDFLTLLVRLSARFVSVRAERVDDEIEDAQRQVCESLGFDRSSLWQRVDAAELDFRRTHGFRSRPGPALPEPMLARSVVPWCLDQAVAGRVVALSTPGDLPPEAGCDAECFRRFGVTSVLSLPLSLGGGPVFGVLTFATEGTERDWPGELVERLQLVAQMFANALARRRTEEELNRLRSQLWHADRAAQVGVITASLAHELNQPLAAILTNAQAGLRFMAGGEPDLDEIRAILSDIVHDDKRAGAVVSGLRALLRRRETARESVGLAEAIREVLDFLRGEILARGVRCALRTERDAEVSADRTQLQQVMLNLVMNAIDAMSDRPEGERRLELTLTRGDGGRALVAVRDSGTGIPEDRRDKLFEPFWTTKGQGMGIGLAISRSIVESHGGRVWFENNADRGATFYVELPVEPGRGDAP